MDGYNQPQTNYNTQEAAPRSRGGTIAIIILFVLVVALGAGGAWLYMNQQNQNGQLGAINGQIQDLNSQLIQSNTYYTSAKGVGAYVLLPVNNAKTNSQLGVLGMIPGNWAQENSFQVQVKDSQGTVIASAAATIRGTWMTGDLQLFTASISIPAGQTGAGTLVLNNANPSGLPANADSISVPIQF